MKNRLLILIAGLGLTLLGLSSFAAVDFSSVKAFSSHFKNWDYRGNYECSASDDGWEEHWGGHSSCSECLSKHGGCHETCYEEYYECTAEGTNDSGFTRQVTERGESEWRTEDRAVDSCRYERLQNCHSKGCNREREKVSTHSC
jgi:hypothetical protein